MDRTGSNPVSGRSSGRLDPSTTKDDGPTDSIIDYLATHGCRWYSAAAMTTVRRLATAAGLSLCLSFVGIPAVALPTDLANLPDEKKAEMAESYYLAGLQYREVGKDELAESMIRLSFSLNPELDPELLVHSRPRALATPELIPPTNPTDKTAWTSSVLVSQLLRLASAFLAHDADAIVDMLDGSIYIAGMDVTRAQAHASLVSLFEKQSLAGTTVRQIYDVGSITVSTFDTGAISLAKAFEVSVDATMDLSAYVPFWSKEQRFVFRPKDNSWLISAILFSDAQQIPASWSPAVESAQAAEQRQSSAATYKQDVAEQLAVVQALLDGADHFLNKDTTGLLATVDRQIMLPDGSLVTHKSLQAVLDHYFATTPYRGLRARDVIKVDSMERLSSGEESAYRVYLSFEDRYQEVLPSIRSGQGFDLRYSDGRWVVFAIS